MTTRKELEKIHEKVDRAIEDSVEPQPASANEIAEKTGQHVTLVARRFLAKGWKWAGRRWVYKHRNSHE